MSKDFKDCTFVPGMTFTIEPIVTMASTDEYLSMGQDQFTIGSPGNPSAQWEHLMLITETGCEVLTKRTEEKDLP